MKLCHPECPVGLENSDELPRLEVTAPCDEGAAEEPRGALLFAGRPFANSWPERFMFPDRGVNVCHPGRPVACGDPKAPVRLGTVPVEEGLANNPVFRLALNSDRPRAALLPFAIRVEFTRGAEKNRCEPGVPARIVDALAAWFVGL